nr:hypothetical protein [Tanacetum cinerariifolium]
MSQAAHGSRLEKSIRRSSPNQYLEYLRHGNKGSIHALSISKMKAARYLDFGLELLVPEHMWIEYLGIMGLANMTWEGTSAHGGVYGNVTVRVRVQVLLWDDRATVAGILAGKVVLVVRLRAWVYGIDINGP